MPELLTNEESRAEHAAMLECESCIKLRHATEALHDLLHAGLMLLDEWGASSHQLYYGERRHLANAHPRYDAHINALAEKQTEAGVV